MEWRKSVLLVLVILISTGVGFGQGSLSIKGKSLTELQQNIQAHDSLSLNVSNFPAPIKGKAAAPPTLRQLFQYPQTMPKMPKAYSFQELGFFCKLEVQMEKKAKFPVKVRLGEVQYVERMEGKYE